MTAADHQRLLALELSLVCDLRSDQERREKPNRLHPETPPAVVNIPVEVRAGDEMKRLLEGGERDLARLRSVVFGGYRDFVHEHRGAWADLFRVLREARSGATVFHCSAGQDRTGFAAALLLLALQVPRQVILDDYMLTAVYRPGEAAVEDIEDSPVPVALLVDIWRPGPAYLEASFDAMEAGFGSLDGYLDAIGVDARVRAALRERLLV